MSEKEGADSKGGDGEAGELNGASSEISVKQVFITNRCVSANQVNSQAESQPTLRSIRPCCPPRLAWRNPKSYILSHSYNNNEAA